MKPKNLNYLFLIAFITVLFSCTNSKSGEQVAKEEINKEETTEEETFSEETYTEENYAEANWDDEGMLMVDVNITPELRKKLNTFFSNFSEVQMEPFDPITLSDEQIIDFAVFHNHINNYKRFENAGNNKIKIKKEYIEETAEKYLNRKISKHQSTEKVNFSNGCYVIEDASGEAFYFSQLEELSDMGDNAYYATVNVYVASSGWAGDYQSNPETWEKEDAPEYYEKMSAVIVKLNDRYVIEEYFYVN